MNILQTLSRHRLVSPAQLNQLTDEGDAALRTVVERKWVSEATLLRAVADDLGMPFVDLSGHRVDAELLRCFPSHDLFRHAILPLESNRFGVTVATSDPLNLVALDELTVACGFFLEPVVACRSQIEEALKRELGVGGGTVREMAARDGDLIYDEVDDDGQADLDDESRASSVIKLVNELLKEAVTLRASDVHLEATREGLDIRYRVDGMLRTQPVAPELHRYRAAIVSRLKILAKLNIAEKRLPQDGRIKMSVSGREIDVRVSIIPMLHGEGIVMRLLDKSKSSFDLSSAEFPTDMAETWRRLIRRPHGLILVTGPTGSGKTTTLYSSLADIRSPFTKIITVEDPIEYDLSGISQIQVQSKIGLTFAAGLRSILRHDPDVVLIGEIRDAETATSAIQASLTGHTVLSTLHTNDAPSAFTRLIDMGIEPYLVAGALEGVLAQRLVRRLCPHCKQAEIPNRLALPADFPQVATLPTLHRAVGCRECNGMGYQGRLAIFELLVTDGTMRQLCNQRVSSDVLRDHSLRAGMATIRQSGWQCVLAGKTSVDEVLRVCSTES